MSSIVIQMKAIRPGRLKVDLILQELQRQLQAEGQYIKGEYLKTTATWRHKPRFEVLTDTTAGNLAVLVGTDDDIYKYVDEGTRPHRIVPKSSNPYGRLFFQSGYVAKTTPGVVGSMAGGKFGNVVAATAVNHPGTKKRGFTPLIKNKTGPRFKRNMQDAMKRGADKAQAEMAKGSI